MVSRTSFKNELDEYRKELGPRSGDSEIEFIHSFLDRWREYPDVEKIWAKIAAIVPDLSPQSFIGGVLHVWEMCERLDRVLEGSPALIAGARAAATQDDDADDYEVAAWKRRQAKILIDRADRLVGRKKDGAPRQYFMRMTSQMFTENTGQYLDDVVASLTEIAFEDTTDGRAVRHARKRNRDIRACRTARHARKRNRDIRTPK